MYASHVKEGICCHTFLFSSLPRSRYQKFLVNADTSLMQPKRLSQHWEPLLLASRSCRYSHPSHISTFTLHCRPSRAQVWSSGRSIDRLRLTIRGPRSIIHVTCCGPRALRQRPRDVVGAGKSFRRVSSLKFWAFRGALCRARLRSHRGRL